MSEFVLRYADTAGEVHSQTAQGASEQEIRERYTRQGFLVYSVKPKSSGISLSGEIRIPGRKRLNLEKFLIFNQQFVTLIRAGLPILKSLDLLADRLTDAKLGPHIRAVRDAVRNGTILSEAFKAEGVFPPIYVTSVLAGEKSGALGEVLDRYITYQKLSLAVRKKLLLSLVYPSLLIVLVICLMVFLITYVVPNFAELYHSMSAQLPRATMILIAIGTTARNYILAGVGGVALLIVALVFWAKTETGRLRVERFRLHTPVIGEIWIKFQVAQFSRVLGTLLIGGIPLLPALETASNSLGARLLQKALATASQKVREGKTLSGSLDATGIFP